MLTLKTIRVGFPTKPICVYWCGYGTKIITVLPDLPSLCKKLNITQEQGPPTNDQLIGALCGGKQKGFAVVDSDVVFFENCEDFEPSGLIAGEFIPEFVCPIAKAVTYSRLHTAFFVVSDPVKLRRAIDLAYRPTIPKFCPFDPFAPVVTFKDGVPHFYDSCSNLYHAIGGEQFGPDMLKRFEHLFGGSYVTKGLHADRIKKAYDDPQSARGVRAMMVKYFEERKP